MSEKIHTSHSETPHPSELETLEGELAAISGDMHSHHATVFPETAAPRPGLFQQPNFDLPAVQTTEQVSETALNTEPTAHESLKAMQSGLKHYADIVAHYAADPPSRAAEGFSRQIAPISWGSESEACQEMVRLLGNIKWDDITIDDGNKIIGDFTAIERVRAQIYATARYEPSVKLPSVMTSLRQPSVSIETVKRLYDMPHSELRTAIETQARGLTAPGMIATEIIGKIYNEQGLDRVPEGQDGLVDMLRSKLSKVDLAILSVPEKPKSESEADIYDHDRGVNDRIFDALGALQLSEGLADKYWLSASSRLMKRSEDDKPVYLNGQKVARRLQIIRDNVNALTPEGIESLHEKFGVTNLDNYNEWELRNLKKLADGDPEYIETMKGRDVTVVFVDARGDHNGAFETEFSLYRNKPGSQIPFEVNSAGDIYRRMALLKKYGIKPCTFVLGAHGEPGKILFGDAVSGFNLAATSKLAAEDDKSFSVRDLSLSHLFGPDFMQPNRGIDSTPDMVGRIQVIIDSCSSDAEFKKNAPTTAESVLKQIGRRDVNTYAAADVMYPKTDAETGDVAFKRWDIDEKKATDEDITRELTLGRLGTVRRRDIKTVPKGNGKVA